MQTIGYKDCKELLDKLIFSLEETFKNDFLSLAIFGSVVRNRVKKESDIDVIIVHKKCNTDITGEYSNLLLKLRDSEEYKTLEKSGFMPDVFPVFIDDEKIKKHPWILLDVLDEGIILIDKGDILKKELENIKENLKRLGSEKIILNDGTWYWDLKPDWKAGELIEI